MSAYGIADSNELTIMTEALEAYCAANQVTQEEERERIALKVICLFRSGVAPERIPEELERVR